MADPKHDNNGPIGSKKLLLVEPSIEVRLTAKWFLSNLGYDADAVPDGESALEAFNARRHSAVITGHLVRGVTELDLARSIKAISPSTPVLAYAEEPPHAPECVNAVVKRPAHLLDLENCVSAALGSWEWRCSRGPDNSEQEKATE